MAKSELQELYQQLRETQFAFVGRGEHHLRDVYRAVQAQFPELCDDSYLCAENCSGGHNQPEWQHTVRKALQSLKGTGVVSLGSRKSYWMFDLGQSEEEPLRME